MLLICFLFVTNNFSSAITFEVSLLTVGEVVLFIRGDPGFLCPCGDTCLGVIDLVGTLVLLGAELCVVMTTEGSGLAVEGVSESGRLVTVVV